MPSNSGCPCVTTLRSGKYTIGGSNNPLTAGAEYLIYAQTKTAAGFLSDVFTITQSTYVASMTSPVVDANSTSITLSVTFESGVGSSVDCVLKDLQGNQVRAQNALDFKSVNQNFFRSHWYEKYSCSKKGMSWKMGFCPAFIIVYISFIGRKSFKTNIVSYKNFLVVCNKI